MTSANVLATGDSPTSPKTPEDYIDFDFIVVDEVDNRSVNFSSPDKGEELGSSTKTPTTMRPREYHRREKKDLALSLLDDFAFQSGVVKRTSLNLSDKVPLGNMCKPARCAPFIVSPNSATKLKANDLAGESHDIIDEASLRSTLGCEEFGFSVSPASRRNGTVDMKTTLAPGTAQRPTAEKSTDSSQEGKLNSESPDETAEGTSQPGEKKKRSSSKLSGRSTVAKSKSPSLADLDCSDQMLSICLPRYNWLEKKLCVRPKEEHIVCSEGEGFVIIDDEKNSSTEDPDELEPQKDEEHRHGVRENDADEKIDRRLHTPKMAETVVAEAKDKEALSTKEEAMNVSGDDWSECIIVEDSGFHGQPSLQSHDEEPIFLPTIDESNHNKEEFGSSTEARPDLVKDLSATSTTTDESEHDDLILIGITTNGESRALHNGFDSKELLPEARLSSPKACRDGEYSQLQRFEAKASQRRDSFLSWKDSNDNCLPLPENFSDDKKSLFSKSQASAHVTDICDPSLAEQEKSVEETEKSKSPIRHNGVLYEKIQSIMASSDGEANQNSQRYQNVNRNPCPMSRTLQDAINAAMVRAILDDTKEDVVFCKESQSPLLNENKSHDEEATTTDKTCSGTRRCQSTSQTRLPPKKRLLNFDNVEESTGSNRSPPLSKRRKTFSRVQKVLPIVLSEGDEQKADKTLSKEDDDSSILIEEDSDDNSAASANVPLAFARLTEFSLQSLSQQKLAAPPVSQSLGYLSSKLPRDVLPRPNTLLEDRAVICSKSASELGKETMPAHSDKLNIKKKNIVKKTRPVPLAKLGVTSKEKTLCETVRSDASDYFAPKTASGSYIQVSDGTVAFNEMRALLPPLRYNDDVPSSESHAKSQLPEYQLSGTRRECPSKPGYMQPPSYQESQKLQTSRTVWPPVYDEMKASEQSASPVSESRPRLSAFSPPHTSAVAIHGQPSPIMSTKAGSSSATHNSMLRWTQSQAPLSQKPYPSPSGIPHSPKPSPVPGHAFHPVTPTHKAVPSRPVLHVSSPSHQVHAHPQANSTYFLPPPFPKPAEMSKHILRPATPQHVSLINQPSPHRASPQMGTVIVDHYSMPGPPPASHRLVTHPSFVASSAVYHMAQPQTNFVSVPPHQMHTPPHRTVQVPTQQSLQAPPQQHKQAHPHLRPMDQPLQAQPPQTVQAMPHHSLQAVAHHTLHTHVASPNAAPAPPIPKEVLLRSQHDPRAMYLQRSLEQMPSSLASMESRYPTTSMCQPSPHLRAHPMVGASTSSMYWSQSRLATAATAQPKNPNTFEQT